MFFKKNYILILLYLLLALLLAICFVGLDNIYFNEINWLLGSGDKSNAQNGWTFFRDDVWRFPLGKNPNYGLDIGTSIIFSDSIPLFAFIFNLFSNFLSYNFQYFSLWIVLCFFMQLYISYLIIYKISNDNFFSTLSSLIFLIAPILIYRISFHISLGGHWLILLGFYLNLICTNKNKRKIDFYWMLLLILSTLIHLYFTVMLFGIYCALLLQKFREEKNFVITFLNLTYSIIFVVFFMYIFGYFETTVISAVSRGYGNLNLDLLSIIDPEVDEGTASTYWSSFFKNIPGTNIEGFNYLGLGNIFIFIIALFIFFTNSIKKKNFIKNFIQNYTGYLVFAVLITFWSLTTNLSFMGKEIINIPLHNYLFGSLSIFAATGRFFWPVYYLIIIFSLITIYRNTKIMNGTIIIIVGLILQLADTYPGLKHHFISRGHLKEPKILENKIWKEIPENFDKFRTTYLYNNYGPLFTSLSHFLGTSKIKKTDIVLVAGMDRAKAALARYDFNNSLYSNKMPEDTAYVIDNLGHLKLMKQILKDTNGGFFYRDNFWLFLPNKKKEMSQKDIDLLSDVQFNEIQLNKRVNFAFEEREKFLGVGWTHNFGNDGVWSEGEIAFVLFRLEQSNNDNFRINFDLKKYTSNNEQNFNVEIYLNNILKSQVNLNKIENLNKISIDVKKSELKNENIIMFKFSNLISPLEIFESPDARKLGILLQSLLVESS